MKIRTVQVGFITAIALAILPLSIQVPGASAIMTKATMPELTFGATGIVRGHVTQVESSWDGAHKTIFTYSTILVEQWLKGGGPETLTVRTIGGQVGDKGLWVEDMPVFLEGQEVITFLVPGQDRSYMTVKGLFQGKFTVESGRVVETGLPAGDFVGMVMSIVRAQEKELNQK